MGSNPLYSFLSWLAANQPFHLPGPAFSLQKGIMPPALPIGQGCHHSEMRSPVCRSCVNSDLQTGSTHGTIQNDVRNQTFQAVSAFHKVNPFFLAWNNAHRNPNDNKNSAFPLTHVSTVSIRLSPTSHGLNQILDVAKKMWLLVKTISSLQTG